MRVSSLDNGLSLVVVPKRDVPVIALQAWVGAGAADDTPATAGTAHFFEHMLFKGTSRRGVGEISGAIEAAGGEINAWTSLDHTVLHAVLGADALGVAIDVLADALQHSAFDPDEIERERLVILEEIRQAEDDPLRAVAQSLFAAAFGRHPYARPVLGEAARVASLRRADLLRFFRRWYVANNVTLVVAGDVDPRRIRARVARAFGSMARAPLPQRRRPRPGGGSSPVRVVTRDVHESMLMLGFPIPPLATPDTAALDALAVILGQGESSRLHRALRRERELVSSVHAAPHALRDAGLFVVGATLRSDGLADAASVIREAIERIRADGVTADELGRAQQALAADAIYERETAQGIARAHGFFAITAGAAGRQAEHLDRIARLEPEAVRVAARRHLVTARASAATLLPTARAGRGAAERVRRRLSRILQRDAPEPAPVQGSAPAPASAVPTRARPAPGQTRASSRVVREVLPGGTRVVVKRDPSVPVVAMRVVWPGGVRVETPQNSGIGHLLASVLTRGCGEWDAAALAARVDRMAGTLSGTSGRNSLGLRAEWLAADWQAGLDMLIDCMVAPHLSADELARERRATLEEIAARADNAAFVAFRAFARALYRKHPYRMDTLGSATSVAEISRRQLVGFFRRVYPVSGATIAIVGDVDPARVLAQVRRRLADAEAAPRPEPTPVHEQFGGRARTERQVFRHLDRQQAQLVVGFPGATVDDPDRHALEVLTIILGGQGGRLFGELRERQSLAYRVGAVAIDGVEPGYVAVHLACRPDRLDLAYRAIRAELVRVVEEPVSPGELRRAIEYLVGTHAIALQRRSAQAAALAFHEAYGLGYEQHERYAALVSAVTIEDVQRVARRFFDWDLAVTATVAPRHMTPEARRRARGERRR